MKKQPIQTSDDKEVDIALRPSSWDEYVGQTKIKESVRLILEAAKQRGESSDHLLFYGQAGLGKTTLAYLIGREMGVSVRSTTGPTLERTGDVAAILSNLEPHEILFIDEVHRMSSAAEEILYPALESRKLHLVVGKGPSAKTVSIDLPPFTVIAATTKVNMLSSPLRSRFGAIFRLDYYQTEDIQMIIKRSANILGAEIKEKAVHRLAKASRLTPRVANRLLRRARDYAQVHQENIIDEEAVLRTLEMLEVDEFGLERADRELLQTMIEKFKGGPVGLSSLGAAIHEEPGTIEEVFEPYLIMLGLLNRTPMGRIVTEKGREYLENKF
ncbi:Holliday junction DNA helicase RuvB [Candidatus Jorgensenbacteria bacterium RIFCSPLOWO2_01_FULL_45_25b]|uniref:Holliday junction branch migration complex subunit RuvB n=1 Tax=Candidatus Jorgensenbacteria bacterium RIFCSPLOWO2_01_FULL_45_25b TaxID=1798471 RepID=A0A1F6BTG7_9BACT|nr:MAG: Holliday junction DNA helicase RuvB [Candidatus Jorgensenbacteria bacterium RIFCSPLOWO2_01_FULL_45_25b]